ncbi:hypothetical protein MWU59_00500 [Flavobacteriaceae bacterium F08102]|nr:hypothetical protein [Flavobacteriaceae bacterium F08102]
MLDLSVTAIKGTVKYAELLAAISGTITYYKYRHTPVKYFLWLLWYIVLTEFVGSWAIKYDFLIFKDEHGVKYNLWMINLLYLIFYPTCFYIYHQTVTSLRYKFWIKLFFIAYLILSLINWTFIQNFIFSWSELPFITGSLMLVVSIIFYFIELLRSEKIIIFHRMLFFWISVGLLLFHTGTIPFSAQINGYALIPGIHKLFLINYVLAIAMYVIFTFGFLWSKKE